MDKKKCGGIICQYIDSTTVIVGLGLNLGKFEVPKLLEFRHGLASVDQSLEIDAFHLKELSQELYFQLLNARINDSQILKDTFNQHCIHLNKDVFIFEDSTDHIGLFRGIGENGEALVEIDSTIQKFISSSLTILD